MDATTPPIIDYHPASPATRTAAWLLRGWALVNWSCTLLAAALVTLAFCWKPAIVMTGGNALAGIIIYTIGGCSAIGCAAWGMLCWGLSNAVAESDPRSTRLALALNLLLGLGCILSTSGLFFLRQSLGGLHWVGTEGTAWRILFASTTPFIVATILTCLILWRIVLFNHRQAQRV